MTSFPELYHKFWNDHVINGKASEKVSRSGNRLEIFLESQSLINKILGKDCS